MKSPSPERTRAPATTATARFRLSSAYSAATSPPPAPGRSAVPVRDLRQPAAAARTNSIPVFPASPPPLSQPVGVPERPASTPGSTNVRGVAPPYAASAAESQRPPHCPNAPPRPPSMQSFRSRHTSRRLEVPEVVDLDFKLEVVDNRVWTNRQYGWSSPLPGRLGQVRYVGFALFAVHSGLALPHPEASAVLAVLQFHANFVISFSFTISAH